MRLAAGGPRLVRALRRHRIPVNGRPAKQHPKLPARRERGVHRTHRPEELLVNRTVEEGIRIRRVLPHLSQNRVRHVVAANEAVHDRLISRVAELDDDVVYDGWKTGMSNERKPKGVSLLVTVQPLAERNDLVGLEGVEDPGHRIDRHCAGRAEPAAPHGACKPRTESKRSQQRRRAAMRGVEPA